MCSSVLLETKCLPEMLYFVGRKRRSPRLLENRQRGLNPNRFLRLGPRGLHLQHLPDRPSGPRCPQFWVVMPPGKDLGQVPMLIRSSRSTIPPGRCCRPISSAHERPRRPKRWPLTYVGLSSSLRPKVLRSRGPDCFVLQAYGPLVAGCPLGGSCDEQGGDCASPPKGTQRP